MKIAHIILVHKNPIQVERLLKKLAHPDSFSFVHVDKKCDLQDFLFLEKLKKVVLIKNRVIVNWGGFSIVKATVYLLKEVARSAIKFDYVNLLSGQDYPLRPASEFVSFLSKNPGKCFFNFNLPGDAWLIEAEQKIRSPFFTDQHFKGKFLLEKILKLILPKRKTPIGYTIVGRSAWFTIDLESVNYILKKYDEQGPIIKFFKYCWGSDEMFFHTLIYNSELKDKMVNDNFRYIDWSEGNPRPKTLTMADAKALDATEAFFARKFELDHAHILDYLDSKKLNNG